MISPDIRAKYTATIGIECHVQLKTKTKLFSAVSNDARQAVPNTLISHIDLGMPGALPVLNAKAVELAMRVAFAFHTKPQAHSFFERKHYFYPDLPKGYQITQLQQATIVGGHVDIDVDGEPQRVRINRVQIEEDAGKSMHPAGQDYSLVDLNRAGTPLLEIVSEPDMHSAAEAKTYARELYLMARYTDVSDADLYQGNMRFDVNVSVSKDPNQLGTRSETKNLNSFRSVEKAVEYEINRQVELLEKGQPVVQETRGWDDAKQKTLSQRGKEEAHDYRYMPEPDLPSLELTDAMITEAQRAMPVLPEEWRQRLASLGLSHSHVETLLEAEIEDPRLHYLPLIEAQLSDPQAAKFMANQFVNVEIPLRRSGQAEPAIEDTKRASIYGGVYDLVKANKLSSTAAKSLLNELLKTGTLPDDLEVYAEQQGYAQVSDEVEITQIVDQVLADNPKAAEDVEKGETKAIGFLVGQVMKASQGKANPELTRQLIKKQLGDV